MNITNSSLILLNFNIIMCVCVVICRMDIKFHYICETVLPVLSHTSVYCSKPVQGLLSLLAQSFPVPSLSLSVTTPGLKSYLSLFTALLVLSFTPGLLTLFTALSFSSLETSWSSQLESIFTSFMFLLVVLDFGYCSLAVSQNFYFYFLCACLQ